jgi:hypothetical protein
MIAFSIDAYTSLDHTQEPSSRTHIHTVNVDSSDRFGGESGYVLPTTVTRERHLQTGPDGCRLATCVRIILQQAVGLRAACSWSRPLQRTGMTAFASRAHMLSVHEGPNRSRCGRA